MGKANVAFQLFQKINVIDNQGFVTKFCTHERITSLRTLTTHDNHDKL
jgi:hypothetical protein